MTHDYDPRDVDHTAYDLEAVVSDAEATRRRRYLQLLWLHPMCSDPGHPGCSACEEE